jgi:hypothetical protein
MSYKYYQPNKKDTKDKCGDCVIRALTKFFDKSWLEIFDELVDIARKNQDIINSNLSYETLLKNHNCVYHKIPRDQKKQELSTFLKGNKEKYFVLVRVGYGGHCVCVDGKDYFDTWDCGEYKVTGYWSK